jgi:hypothetical protein
MDVEARARYEEIIEIAGRWFAFATPGDTLPRTINDLMSEAVELRDGWGNLPPGAVPGTAELPVLDAIIDEVIERANALRRSFMRVAGPRYRH